MPEADLSALQPPVRSATSRHKKFQETNSIRLFNRARTKPCFFQSQLTRIYARPRIPQAVPWLQEFSPQRKLSLAGACLKPTYPVQRKEYPHSSCRIVLSHTGRHKKDSKKQILSHCSIEYAHSFRPVASGHKKRSRSVVAAGPSRRRLPTLPLAQYHRRDEA